MDNKETKKEEKKEIKKETKKEIKKETKEETKEVKKEHKIKKFFLIYGNKQEEEHLLEKQALMLLKEKVRKN